MATSGTTLVSASNAKYQCQWNVYDNTSTSSKYDFQLFFALSYYVPSVYSGARSFDYTITINGVTRSGTGKVENPSSTGYKAFSTMSPDDLSYDLDGTKSYEYSFSITYDGVTASGSGTATLDKCAYYPELYDIGNGTLGATLDIDARYCRAGHTYDLSYSTVYDSGTIATGLTLADYGKIYTWTPPLSLVEAYPNRSNISVTVTLKAYYNGVLLSTSTSTGTFSLPSTYAPTVSISVSDLMGYLAKYGAYVQSHSRVGVAVTASGKNGATIAAYSTQIDGGTYSGASVESDPLKSSGTLTVKTTVTDSRGMTASASQNITVLAYDLPKVTEITAMRSDASGNYLPSGGYYKITFYAEITALNNKNSAKYVLKYKKTAETAYTEQTVTAYGGDYTVSGGSVIVSAVASSAYDLIILATDDFGNGQRGTIGESGAKLFSILAKGLGFAFNKLAEIEGVFDVGFKTKFTGGILPNTLPNGANFDDLKTQNIYVGNAGTGGYVNCPVTSGEINLDVKEIGSAGQIVQRLECIDSRGRSVYERVYSGAWLAWTKTDEQIILPSGYTAVDCLVSSGTQYINTGFTPKQNTRLEMDAQHTGGATEFLFGVRNTSNAAAFAMLCTGDAFRSDYAASRLTFSGVDITARNKIDFNKNVSSVGGATVTHTATTFTAPNSLMLLACATGSSVGYYASAKLYSAKLYDNGTLIRDFVPCKNSSGVLGLYDLVNNKFYTNAGSGTFGAG